MERLTSKRVNGIKSGYWSTAKKDELIQRLGQLEDEAEQSTWVYPERNDDGIKWWRHLPDHGVPVIICRMYDPAEKIVKIEQATREFGGWWKVYGTRVKSILAWRPMPTPPECVLKIGEEK